MSSLLPVDRPFPTWCVECFWRKVDRSGGPDACWPWTGTLVSGKGYGGSHQTDGGPRYAHRRALELTIGRPLTRSEFACHHCDNPPCCNPAHLFLGSALDNARDRDAKGRGIRGRTGHDGGGRGPEPKTHCKRGHPLSGDNLVIWSGKQRRCRICTRNRTRNYRPSWKPRW